MFKIRVGTVGPTDCTLLLDRGLETREYLIDGAGWKFLCKFPCNVAITDSEAEAKFQAMWDTYGQWGERDF